MGRQTPVPAVDQLLGILGATAIAVLPQPYKKELLTMVTDVHVDYMKFTKYRNGHLGVQIAEGLRAIRQFLSQNGILFASPMKEWIDHYCDDFGAIS